MDKLVVQMPDTLTFNKSVRGAGHIRSGKPCQDFSISYQDDKVKILIVCDGHGGNTYFRSEVGAELAANACLENMLHFASCTPSSAFEGYKFAITAKPQKNPFIDAEGNRVRFENLDETQQRYAKQAQAYIAAEGECLEQQTLIKSLLSDIYTEWRNRISRDEKIKPFTKNEKSIIAHHGIEKAYGCTMLAYMQTEHYWLSFQIGDGEIYVCDKTLTWKTPVPEDCACFLNYTTSLCDQNPLIEFRYTFNGVDDAPVAAILCSDGLDGSLRSQENITDFYEQVIGLYIDGDDVESELESYLPQLSELGNKDDISLAGYIHISDQYIDNFKLLLNLKKDSRNIQTEFRTRKQDIESLSARLETLRIKLERHKDTRFMRSTEIDEMHKILREKESVLEDLDKVIADARMEIEKLEKDLSDKVAKFEEWKFNIKNQMADIEARQNEITGSDRECGKQDNTYTNW